MGKVLPDLQQWVYPGAQCRKPLSSAGSLLPPGQQLLLGQAAWQSPLTQKVAFLAPGAVLPPQAARPRDMQADILLAALCCSLKYQPQAGDREKEVV